MILAKLTEENQKILAVTLLLKDSARIWFDFFTPKPTTMAGLTALFVELLKRDNATVWRDVAQLWNVLKKRDKMSRDSWLIFKRERQDVMQRRIN